MFGANPMSLNPYAALFKFPVNSKDVTAIYQRPAGWKWLFWNLQHIKDKTFRL